MDWFDSKKKQHKREREILRDKKLHESREQLLTAAVSTAQVAQLLTISLQGKLDDSNAQIEKTASIMNDALVICDAKTGKIQAFNPAAEKMFGKTFEEVRNSYVGNIFSHHGVSAKSLWSLLDTQFLKGLHSNGTIFHIDINHASLLRSDGNSIVLLIIKLRNNQEPNESIFIDNGIVVIQDNQVVAANPQAKNEYEMADITKAFTNDILEGTKSLVLLKSNGNNAVIISVVSNKIWWRDRPAYLITMKDSKTTEHIVERPIALT